MLQIVYKPRDKVRTPSLVLKSLGFHFDFIRKLLKIIFITYSKVSSKAFKVSITATIDLRGVWLRLLLLKYLVYGATGFHVIITRVYRASEMVK